MKAITKTVPGKGVELIDIPAPRVRPGDLLVEVKACDSDLTDRAEFAYGSLHWWMATAKRSRQKS